MKIDGLKKLIKEAVKEAIQEELKEILLEAIVAPKGTPVGTGGYEITNNPIVESRDTYAQPHLEKPRQLTAAERKEMFGNIINEMQRGGTINSAYAGNLQVNGPVDTVNGTLPEGQVGLDQIMALMNK